MYSPGIPQFPARIPVPTELSALLDWTRRHAEAGGFVISGGFELRFEPSQAMSGWFARDREVPEVEHLGFFG